MLLVVKLRQGQSMQSAINERSNTEIYFTIVPKVKYREIYQVYYNQYTHCLLWLQWHATGLWMYWRMRHPDLYWLVLHDHVQGQSIPPHQDHLEQGGLFFDIQSRIMIRKDITIRTAKVQRQLELHMMPDKYLIHVVTVSPTILLLQPFDNFLPISCQ